MLPCGFFSPSDPHQGAECSSVLSWCPETPAVHPSPTWRKLGYKRHLGLSAISQITYPALPSKGVSLLCPVFSAKQRVTVIFVNSFFFLFFKLKKKSQVLTKGKRKVYCGQFANNNILSTVLVSYPETAREPDAQNECYTSNLRQGWPKRQTCRAQGALGYHLQQTIVSPTMKQRQGKPCGISGETVPSRLVQNKQPIR